MVGSTIGLYYNGARYLAAWLGRWTSADPVGIGADGPGLYNYTRGSPVNYTDPSGTDSSPAQIKKMEEALQGARAADEARYYAALSVQAGNHAAGTALLKSFRLSVEAAPVAKGRGGIYRDEPLVVTPEQAHMQVQFVGMGEDPREARFATLGQIVANKLYEDIDPNASDFAALARHGAGHAINKSMGAARTAGTRAPEPVEAPRASTQSVREASVAGGPPPSGATGSSGGSSGGGGRGYVSGFQEILGKARAARAGDVGALGEIQVAKQFRSEGQNVHFQTPTGKRGSGSTVDLLVGGQRGTGSGGVGIEVYTPRTTNPDNVAVGLKGKNDQATRVAVNIRNNPALSRAALGGESGLMQGLRDLVEPTGRQVNIVWLRIFD